MTITWDMLRKLRREPGFAEIPLELLVTAPYEDWDLELMTRTFAGCGVLSRVRYLSPDWALVVLVADPAVYPEEITDETPVRGWGVYLRYFPELRDWRISRIGPEVDPRTLPS